MTQAAGSDGAMARGEATLHVVAPAEFGGLERVVRLLAAGQRQRGRQAEVLAFLDEGQGDDHPFVRDVRGQGVPVEAIALPHRAYAAERSAVEAAIRRLHPAVVHTHGSRVDVVDIPVVRGSGVPAVSTVHGFVGGGIKARLYEVLHRRALRGADAVVAVSRPLATDLQRAGVPTERLHVVPNAWRRIDEPLPEADALEELGANGFAGPVIGWVGRLSREKAADVFVDALALCRDVEMLAVVIGDGPDRDRLERRAGALGVAPRIRWAGTVRAASRVFSALDLFVLSARTEGTPIALFEAIDAGVPVVATAVGGVPDVVGPDGALLVPPDDPPALAAAIRSALIDRSQALARAERAAARLRGEYGVEQWLDRYETVYRAAAARRRGARPS